MSDVVNLANYLNLERPIATLDLETTGVDPEKDRICQIAITMHYLDRNPIAWVSLINPQQPSHPKALAAHGLTEDKLKDAPTFPSIGKELAKHLLDVDIMGYNVVFDIGFLRAEMKRHNIPFDWKGYTIDAYQIYSKLHTRHLLDAWLAYGGPGGNPMPEGSNLEGAHDAGVDVLATEQTLRGMLLQHPDIPRTVKELSEHCFPPVPNAIDESDGSPNWRPKFVYNDDDVPCINFGKWGRSGPYPMRKVPRDYYQFILSKDFSASVKKLAQDALNGKYPQRNLVDDAPTEEPVI